jgi:hypothetical protein
MMNQPLHPRTNDLVGFRQGDALLSHPPNNEPLLQTARDEL